MRKANRKVKNNCKKVECITISKRDLPRNEVQTELVKIGDNLHYSDY